MNDQFLTEPPKPKPNLGLAPNPGLALTTLEAKMLHCPQAQCSVRHHFAPGIYLRELWLPAGIVALGHHQKFAVLNLMVTGRVSLLNDDGTITELTAPQTFLGQAGRKLGYIHEAVVWHNVFPNPDNETDIETLEARWLEKSPTFLANATQRRWLAWQEHQPEREDYDRFLAEFNFAPAEVQKIVENEADQIPMPAGSWKVLVTESPIHGQGLLATAKIVAGEMICPARLNGFRTPAGRYTNHSPTPNAEMVPSRGSVPQPDGDIWLRAIQPIAGCAGGQPGTEITVNYRQALAAGKQSRGLA